jgi:hypothetical protein
VDMGQGADGSPWGTTHVEGHVETAAQDRYPQVGDNKRQQQAFYRRLARLRGAYRNAADRYFQRASRVRI